MNKPALTVLFLSVLSLPIHADTLYQENIGGYSAGTGFGTGLGYVDSTEHATTGNLTPFTGSGYYAGTVGVPVEGQNYPSLTPPCTGCNRCNQCGNNGY